MKSHQANYDQHNKALNFFFFFSPKAGFPLNEVSSTLDKDPGMIPR